MRGRRHDLELTISTIASTRAHSFVRSSSSSSSSFDMQAYKNKGKTRRKKKVALRRQEREAEAAEREATGVVADDQSDDDDGLPPHPAGESAIISMTADFAMQNVILQMGLARAVKKKKTGTGSSLMRTVIVIVGLRSDDAILDPDGRHDACGYHDDRHHDDELTHRWPTPPTPTPTPCRRSRHQTGEKSPPSAASCCAALLATK